MKKLTAAWITNIRAFDTKYVDGRFHILQNYKGEFGVTLSDCRTVVPYDGFVFDMASVPRAAWPLFPPDGDGPHAMYGPAACVHDYLYIHQSIGDKCIDRKYADMVFKAVLELSKVSPWRVWIMYQAVRIGGQGAWNRHKGGK